MNNATDRSVTDRIALIDLDGTIADYDGEMHRRMELIRGPNEPVFEGWDNVPPHISCRRDLIKKQPGFWRGLPRLRKGFEVVDELREFKFELHVLTKGPVKTTSAWTEKVEWCQENIPDANVTVTQDKSIVYGRILFDDFPPYFTAWLRNRPRGLVICLAHPWNAQYGVGGSEENANVFRYSGLDDVHELRARLRKAFDRGSGQSP
jgi:5'(3')-deoxyribonucleotidase